mmetsp:Transcript_46573/g.88939  ORF Transcript_46573/g.88939 Transcript_46573/m.88939 type:complete len:221 (-) Transcript_46573:364-1026(-)
MREVVHAVLEALENAQRRHRAELAQLRHEAAVADLCLQVHLVLLVQQAAKLLLQHPRQRGPDVLHARRERGHDARVVRQQLQRVAGRREERAHKLAARALGVVVAKLHRKAVRALLVHAHLGQPQQQIVQRRRAPAVGPALGVLARILLLFCGVVRLVRGALLPARLGRVLPLALFFLALGGSQQHRRHQHAQVGQHFVKHARLLVLPQRSLSRSLIAAA